MKRLVLLVLIVAGIHGCGSSESPITPRTGEQFQLKYGQTAVPAGGGLVIRFSDVRQDSRCPVDAVCIWAGNAQIVLEVSRSDYALNTTLEPREVTHLGYGIMLLQVDPHRKLNEEIELKDYTATLMVTKE